MPRAPGRSRRARPKSVTTARRPPGRRVVGHEHDVGALEVAVDHAGLVGGGERGGHLLDERQGVLAGAAARAVEAARRASRRRAAPSSGTSSASWWKTSKMRQTLGCVTLRARWTSRRKRSIVRGSFATSGRIVFSATRSRRTWSSRLVDLAHAAARDEADDAEAAREQDLRGEDRRLRGERPRRGKRSHDGGLSVAVFVVGHRVVMPNPTGGGAEPRRARLDLPAREEEAARRALLDCPHLLCARPGRRSAGRSFPPKRTRPPTRRSGSCPRPSST